MTRLRILHVITRLVVGGAQENTLATAAGQLERGHAVVLATGPSEGSEGSLVERARARGLDPVLIPQLVRELSPARDAQALARLYRLTRDGSFDVVHTHTSKAGVLGRVAARLARVPVVVHTPHGHVFDGYFGPLATRAFVAMERACARRTSAMIAISSGCRRDHLALGIGTAERFAHIPSGIPIGNAGDRATARRLLGAGDGVLLVGCVGRLAAVKGQQLLLPAFARATRRGAGVRLVLVGDGPSRAELEERSALLGINAEVRFLGLRDDVPALLPGFDLYVQPSLNEGMGRALAQAMAAGLPVVVTDAPGPAALAADGAGVIVPAGDVDALAGAIETLLEDAELRVRLGRAARRRAADFWSEEDMVGAIERLYLELTAGASRISTEGGSIPWQPATS